MYAVYLYFVRPGGLVKAFVSQGVPRFILWVRLPHGAFYIFVFIQLIDGLKLRYFRCFTTFKTHSVDPQDVNFHIQ